MKHLEHRGQWHSSASYVLVTTGAMVGLGNILYFPFLVVKYGGLFILFYFICQLSVALPLLFAELLIGRRGKQNPVGSIEILTMETHASDYWRKLGWACVFIGFLTIIYYAVTAAFPASYFIANVVDIYHHAAPVHLMHDVSGYSQTEVGFVVMLVLAMLVVYRGIHRGLEEISMVTVPLYFITLLSLAIYVSTLGYFGDAVRHLFASSSDASFYEIFVAALTLAFMKYKTGMGVMIVYGSYLPYHVPLAKSTLIVVAIDALVSLLSYFIIFPLTFALSPDAELIALSGHNVISIFSALPNGLIISAIFFFAAVLIAWTPIIAMGETLVITLIERLYWSRVFATTVIVLLVLLFGSFEVGTHFQWAEAKFFGEPLHKLLKHITLDILTPIVAFFIAIFAGWVLTRDITESELHIKPGFYALWRCLIRYVVPVGVALVLFTITSLENFSF